MQKVRSAPIFSRPVCTRCFSSDIEWVPACGQGKVHSFTLVRVPRNPAFKEEVPICYADIILEEGVLMQSRIMGKEIEKVEIGTRVRVIFQ
ncbi:MAG: Zn-ribbon domain-containing OB-fold protein, partial [Candidatus Methylomirabilales bacterium]